MTRSYTTLLAGIAALTLAAGASAQDRVFPVIQGYGGVKPSPTAANRPDPKLDYKVVFNITKAAPNGAKNISLSKVARFLNLLGEDGIRPAPGKIMPIVQHEATSIVLSDAAFAKAFPGRANPDAELIARLSGGGRAGACLRPGAGWAGL